MINMRRSVIKEDPEEPVYSCNECQAGQMHPRYVTYFTWLGGELITVPDFPAWVCDVCGRRDYDPQALRQLSLLLNPAAGKPSSRISARPAKPPRAVPRPSQPE
jgi:YgiT-type zinc finger domain-containing protein